MLTRLRHILEMIRFSHTLFALPFALLAAVMAWSLSAHEAAGTVTGADSAGEPSFGRLLLEQINPLQLLGILICMVAARSAAMAFNRLADWKIDAQNPRTRARHIPAGVLTVRSVATFAVVCSALFVAGTLLFLPNRLPLYLSLPVLAFLLGYSLTKRFTDLAHVWLGAALMLAPLSAWIALRGSQVQEHPADLLPALVLGLAVLLWVTGFDIIYACQDVEFDSQSGLHSIPARLGVPASLRLAAACHLGMLIALAVLPLVYPLGTVYVVGVALVAALLVYEHSLVRPNDLTRVNQAFFQVNAVVSLGLFAVTTLDLLVARPWSAMLN